MLFFFIELLRKWNYNVGGELDNLEVVGGLYAKRRYC